MSDAPEYLSNGAIQRLRNQVRRLARLETDVIAARLKLGRELVAIRTKWPQSGPNARGWGEFLQRIELSRQRAWELMRLADWEEPEPEDSSGTGQNSAGESRSSEPNLGIREHLTHALAVLATARRTDDIVKVHSLIDEAHRLVSKAVRA